MKKILLFLIIVVDMVIGGFLGGIRSEEAKAFATKENLSEFFVKAVNPGYTVDGASNVGEMIEIGRRDPNEMKSLAGLALSYTNSSGNEVLLVDFSKYIWKTGENIYLSLASSPGSELAQVQYVKTLAFKAGPLRLTLNGEEIDTVCWTGKEGCFSGFSSSNPTTLVRNMETGDFEHVTSYVPSGDGVLEMVEEAGENGGEVSETTSQCKGVEFSEILSYYETLQSEQFVELHNRNVEAVRLDGCTIKYKNKYYPLSGLMMADGYFVREATDFKLTKNPTTSNVLELVDANGEILDKLVYPNGQKKGTAYVLIGYDKVGEEIWKVSYLPTPGEPNVYQEFQTCEASKVINEATGNCVKVSEVTEKVCPEGQYLNILTGRCKKKPEAVSEKVCKEGYYLNEETGRCRKIQENTGADFALVSETYASESSFVALYLVLGVVGVGLIYVMHEFRHEILKIFRRIKWW